jgi:hypothetical protein
LLALAGTGGFFFFGTFAYIAASPFAYITYHHLPAQYYGLLFGAGIVGLIATNLLNSRLVMRLGIERLLFAGNSLAALAGAALAINAWTGWGGLAGLAVPLSFFVSAKGLIIANSVAGALSQRIPSRLAPSQRWLERFTTAQELPARRSLASWLTGRRGQWALSLRSPASAACCA